MMEQGSKCPICGGNEIVYSQLKGMWECLTCGACVYDRALTEQEIRQHYEESAYACGGGIPGDFVTGELRSGESSEKGEHGRI